MAAAAEHDPVKDSFVAAAKHHVQDKLNDRLAEVDKLVLYGLYKQATQGACTYEKPNPDTTPELIVAKWNSWRDVSELPREQAAVRYVLKVQECDPAWVPPHDVRGMDTTPALSDSAAVDRQISPNSVVDSAAADSQPPSPRTVAEAAMPPRQALSPSPSTPQTLKGVLFKQRDFVKSWRARHFQLEDQMLHYYVEVNDPTPRKSLLITNCTVTPAARPIQIPSENPNNAYYPFVIAHPESTYCYNLAATSSAARDQWVEALKEAAKPRYTPSISISDGPAGASGLAADLLSAADGAGVGANADYKAAAPTDIPTEHAEKIERTLATLLAAGPHHEGWEDCGEKLGVHGYRKTGGKFVSVKGVGDMPNQSIAEVFKCIFNLGAKGSYDKQFDSGKRTHVHGTHTVYDLIQFKPVWPTTARDFFNILHWRMVTLKTPNGGSEEALVMVTFGIPPAGPDSTPTKDFVRGELIFGGWIFRPAAGGKGTNVTYLVQTDLKGALPKAVVNSVATQQAFLVAAVRNELDAQSPTLDTAPLSNAACEKIADEINAMLKPNLGAPPGVDATGGAADAAGLAATPSAPAAAAPTTPTKLSTLSWDRMCVLLMPILLYTLSGRTGGHYRALMFLVGMILSVRYVINFKLGTPVPKRTVTTQWGDPVGGTVLVKFPIELKRLLRYLEQRRKDTGVEINVTHLTMKAVAIALQEMPNLNGHISLGRFYRNQNGTSDVSYCFPLANGGFAAVCVDGADKKPVDWVARELRANVEQFQTGQDPLLQRRMALLSKLPAFCVSGAEKVLGFLGNHLGFSVPRLGVRPFPFGTCTVITPPSEGSDMEVDVVGASDGAGATQPLAPVVITVGGIRVQSGYMKDKQMAARPVLHMSGSVDLRCATMYEAKQLFERVQQLMRDPVLIDKHDRTAAKGN